MSKTRNLGNLTDVLTAGSTYATGATPPQFDSGTNIPTTAFVQRALGSYSSSTGLSSTQTLTAAHAGMYLNIAGATPSTYTLPLTSSLPVGTAISFHSTSSAINTISRQGSDTVSINGSTITSVALNTGSTATFVVIASGLWFATGTATLYATPEFGSSLATAGWQKLPSGLIMQWGSGTTNSSGALAITWPIAFPNATLSATGSGGSGVPAAYIVSFAGGTKTTGSFFAANSSGTGIIVSVWWIAIGY